MRSPPHAGQTLVELLITVAVAAILAGGGVRAARPLVDRARVRLAAAEVRATFDEARRLAVLRAERVAVRIDTTRGGVAVHVLADSALRRPLGALYGVRLSATRDSMAYGGTGLGHGVANLRVVARRGAVAETVWVSRLGRVR